MVTPRYQLRDMVSLPDGSTPVINLPPRFHFLREDLLVDSVCVPRLCFGQRTHHPFGVSRLVLVVLRGH